MPRIFINLKAGCPHVNLMSTSAQINQLKYTILYYHIKPCDIIPSLLTSYQTTEHN